MGLVQHAPRRGRAFRRVVTALAGAASLTMLFGAGVASASPGFLNSSFAGGEALVHQFGSGSSPTSMGGGVAVASNGDIYQVGSATTTSGAELYIARYLPSGALDASFGPDHDGVTYESVTGFTGTAIPQYGPFGGGAFVALAPGGDPVVLTDATTASGGLEMVVLEFTQTGQLNGSFDSDGVYEIKVPGNRSLPGGLAVASNGDIVFTGAFENGSGQQQFVAGQLTSSGTVDSSFDGGKLLEPTLGTGVESIGMGVIAQSNGDLVFDAVTTGTSGQEFAILRATSAGQLDGSFGTAGTGVAYIPDPTILPLNPGLVETPDGGYAIASSSPGPTQNAMVTRLTAEGQPDKLFGTGGSGTAVVPTSALASSIGDGLFAQADGKLIVTGLGFASTGAPGPFVARFNTDGTLDTSFGSGGVSFNPLTGSAAPTALPVGVAETPDGNLLLSGVALSSAPESFLQEVNLDTAPTLVTAASASSVQAGTPVQFVAAAVANDGYTVGQISWDFGGGSFGAATGSSVSHTFTTPGTYTVRAQVTDSFGLSSIATQTITVTAAPPTATTPATPTAATTSTPTATTTGTPTVTPAIKKAPKLRLLSIKASHGKIKVRLSCSGVACKVTGRLLTHLISGKAASLSSDGHGKHAKAIKVGSAKFTVHVGRAHTFTIKLNKVGRELLKAFHTIPASASFRLTNSKPAKTIHHKVRIR